MTSCLATVSSPTKARVTTTGFRAKRSASGGRRRSSSTKASLSSPPAPASANERFRIAAFDVPILQLQLKAD